MDRDIAPAAGARGIRKRRRTEKRGQSKPGPRRDPPPSPTAQAWALSGMQVRVALQAPVGSLTLAHGAALPLADILPCVPVLAPVLTPVLAPALASRR